MSDNISRQEKYKWMSDKVDHKVPLIPSKNLFVRFQVALAMKYTSLLEQYHRQQKVMTSFKSATAVG